MSFSPPSPKADPAPSLRQAARFATAFALSSIVCLVVLSVGFSLISRSAPVMRDMASRETAARALLAAAGQR